MYDKAALERRKIITKQCYVFQGTQNTCTYCKLYTTFVHYTDGRSALLHWNEPDHTKSSFCFCLGGEGSGAEGEKGSFKKDNKVYDDTFLF